MSIVYIASATGAPGVSTLAAALTLNWPRPALLLEADTSKTSHIIPGYLQAQYKHTHGLTEAAIANLRGDLTAEVLFSQTISLGEGKYAIPGFSDLGGARGSTSSFWASMTRALAYLPQEAQAPDLDIFVDAGRYHPADSREALIAQADAILLVTGNTLPDINVLYTATPSLLHLLEAAGHQDYVSLVISKSAHKNAYGPALIGPGEIKGLLKLDTLGTVPWEPAAAAHFSHGAPEPGRKSPYLSKLSELVAGLDEALAARRFTPQEGSDQ